MQLVLSHVDRLMPELARLMGDFTAARAQFMAITDLDAQQDVPQNLLQEARGKKDRAQRAIEDFGKDALSPTALIRRFAP